MTSGTPHSASWEGSSSLSWTEMRKTPSTWLRAYAATRASASPPAAIGATSSRSASVSAWLRATTIRDR